MKLAPIGGYFQVPIPPSRRRTPHMVSNNGSGATWQRPGMTQHHCYDGYLQSGMAENQTHHGESPLACIELSIKRMQANDLSLFLVLTASGQIIGFL
ncbi:MAG: hypothetical protein CL388_03665 [Acidiferrobacteraceae bacterium]|jgi:hypothetical protein|nr:hypothetical protein [Acidiferrobacteraceae bacterium]